MFFILSFAIILLNLFIFSIKKVVLVCLVIVSEQHFLNNQIFIIYFDVGGLPGSAGTNGLPGFPGPKGFQGK